VPKLKMRHVPSVKKLKRGAVIQRWIDEDGSWLHYLLARLFLQRDNGKVWKLKSINNGWIARSNSHSSGRRKWDEERSTGGWVSRRELGWTVKKDEEGGRREGGMGGVLRGLRRVKRIDVAAGRRCVIYFPSLPRRGRTSDRRGVPRALHAPMNQSHTTTTVFHPRTTLVGRAAKILRKSQAMINHAGAPLQQVKPSQM
jgi:hypothetical protein